MKLLRFSYITSFSLHNVSGLGERGSRNCRQVNFKACEVRSSLHRHPIHGLTPKSLANFLFECFINRMYRIQFLLWTPLLICAIFFHLFFFGLESHHLLYNLGFWGERSTRHVTFLLCNLVLFFQYQSNCIS